MASLNNDMKAAVDNYANDIITLKDFVTAVRKRPGMYIGAANDAILNCIREIYQNSIDQMVDPGSPCDWFSLYYNEQTLEFVVEDNGLGFPFDQIIRILTTQHTSKNFEKKLFQYSSGLHGIGAKVVNALSESFKVESYRYDGKAVKMEFNKGYPKYDKPKSIPNPNKKQGSRITFIPDTEILEETNLDWKTLYRQVKNIMSLTPLGCHMDFYAVDSKGKKITESITNTDGILTNIIMKVKQPVAKPIVIKADDGTHKLECAICYDVGGETGPMDMESVTAFSNFCPTRGGTHVEGTIEGITRWFTLYMNNIYLANQKSKVKTKVNAADIKTGLNLMIGAAHLEPIMVGQSKELLSNPDMIPFCKEVVMKGLDEWSKSNPQDLSKLAKFFKEVAELRMKNEGAKQKIAKNYHSNALSGLPDKYAKPLGKEHLELLIVEGDSAGGQAKNGRDKYRQGVFPIRGKMPNAFQKSYKDFMSNAEVQAIIHILLGGKEYTRKFDPYKDVKYEKVIFMADADVDREYCPEMLFA
jgi:DNA gyrase subunit B